MSVDTLRPITREGLALSKLFSGVQPTGARARHRPRRLRIAQVAPVVQPVPPARYGGTEQVIATLTEELVQRGHEVTLADVLACQRRPALLDHVYGRAAERTFTP